MSDESVEAVMTYLEAHPRVLEETVGPATIDWSSTLPDDAGDDEEE